MTGQSGEAAGAGDAGAGDAGSSPAATGAGERSASDGSTGHGRTSAVPTGRTGVFVSICAFSFLVNFGRVAFAPLVDFFIESGVSPATAGLAATAVWVGSALPRLPTGYLLTFVSRHRTILGMGVCLAAAAAYTAVATGIWFVVAGALFIGLATGVFFIAANPLVSELYPENVGVAVGIRGMSSQIAAVSAPFLVGLAIGLGSWQLAFGTLAALAVVATIAFAVAVRRADMPTAGAEDRDLLAGIAAQWPLVLAGIVFVGVTGFVWQGVFNFYVTYLTEAKELTQGTASTLLTLVFAAGVPSFLIGGRLADRVPFLALFVTILGGFALSLVALTMAQGLLAIAAVSALMGLIIHGLFPLGDAYLLGSLPDENRASAYAGYSATMMLIQAPGSVAVGLLAETGLSYDGVFVGYAMVVGLVVVVMGGLAWSGKLPSGG